MADAPHPGFVATGCFAGGGMTGPVARPMRFGARRLWDVSEGLIGLRAGDPFHPPARHP